MNFNLINFNKLIYYLHFKMNNLKQLYKASSISQKIGIYIYICAIIAGIILIIFAQQIGDTVNNKIKTIECDFNTTDNYLITCLFNNSLFQKHENNIKYINYYMDHTHNNTINVCYYNYIIYNNSNKYTEYEIQPYYTCLSNTTNAIYALTSMFFVISTISTIFLFYIYNIYNENNNNDNDTYNFNNIYKNTIMLSKKEQQIKQDKINEKQQLLNYQVW
jgi:hypothetical protein